MHAHATRTRPQASFLRSARGAVSALAALGALALSATPAQALTVLAFDTIGPANYFVSNLGWGVGGGSSSGPTGTNYVQAQRFQADASGTLSGITAAIHRQLGSSNVSFKLLTDSATGTPGTELVSTSVQVPDSVGLLTADFSAAPALEKGAYYWFSISTADTAAAHTWNMNAYQFRGVTAFAGANWQSPGTWSVQEALLGAFQVSVLASPVPEPGSALLLLAGLAVPALVRTLRRPEKA